VFLLRGKKLVQLSELTFENQQEKFLVWQHIAEDVCRRGADGFVFIGETWLSRREGLTRGVRPSDARDREEAIHVFAARSTGDTRSLVIPFSRGLLGRSSSARHTRSTKSRKTAHNERLPAAHRAGGRSRRGDGQDGTPGGAAVAR
jgi:hypothetical protein